MPGVVVNVRWPRGKVLGTVGDRNIVDMMSADPNDHYRPFLEQHVGRQGWDWNWGMGDRDATEDRLTIKIRRHRAQWATVIALQWQ